MSRGNSHNQSRSRGSSGTDSVADFRRWQQDTVARFRGRDTGTIVRYADHEPVDGDLVRRISRVTWVGVVVNVALALLKVAGGVLGASRALIADAVHTISDLATDAAILIGVRYWSKPADDDHPHGHGKIETLVTLGIGVALAFVGFGLGYEAAVGLVRGVVAGAEGGSVPALSGGAILAFVAAAASILCKELLYRWTVREGRKLRSSALVANAWHHRSDALSSIPPALAVAARGLGSVFGYDLWYLDALGALVVCCMLLGAAWEVTSPTLLALLDAGADRKTCADIRKIVLETPGVLGAHAIRSRYIGAEAVAVDLCLLVDGGLTVTGGHDIAVRVNRRILEKCASVVDVVIHVEPADHDRKGRVDAVDYAEPPGSA